MSNYVNELAAIVRDEVIANNATRADWDAALDQAYDNSEFAHELAQQVRDRVGDYLGALDELVNLATNPNA